MLIAFIIVVYFIVTLTLALFWLDFEKSKPLGIITFILCPPIAFVINLILIVYHRRQRRKNEKEMGIIDNPFKAKEGQRTCNSCVYYKHCAELNKSTEHLDGCVICKYYEKGGKNDEENKN